MEINERSTIMRYYVPDSADLSGNDNARRSADTVLTGMENDPNADEKVINQEANDTYPEPVRKEGNSDEEKTAKLTPDKLADSIAYALDGSGPGPANARPNVSGHDVIIEGTSGAGPEEEERIFGK